MGLAAVMILIYHLCPAPHSSNGVTQFLNFVVKSSYLGVDVFFFLSAYSAAFSDDRNYGQYIKRKFSRTYPLFILAVIVQSRMRDFPLRQAIFTLLNIDVFIRGGASFLWFLQAIHLFYLLAPFIKKLKPKKYNLRCFGLFMILWFVLMLSLEAMNTNHSMNILLCRIPILILGLVMASYEGKLTDKQKGLIFLPLFAVGIFLTWTFAFVSPANHPITNLFYVYSIPTVIGLMGLSDLLFSHYPAKLLTFLGQLSLELYAVQMIFASPFILELMRIAKHLYLASFLATLFIVLIAYAIHSLSAWVKKQIPTKVTSTTPRH